MKRFEKEIIGLVMIALIGAGVLVFDFRITPPRNLYADSWGKPSNVPEANVYVSPEKAYTLLTANTAGLTGTAQDLTFTATKHYCVITTAGTAPTSVVVSLYMSIDNSAFPTTLTHTYTIGTATTRSFAAMYPARYVKGSFDSKVGGDATTTVTLKCVGTK